MASNRKRINVPFANTEALANALADGVECAVSNGNKTARVEPAVNYWGPCPDSWFRNEDYDTCRRLFVSYSTPIALELPVKHLFPNSIDDGYVWLVNPNKYSCTTSKHLYQFLKAVHWLGGRSIYLPDIGMSGFQHILMLGVQPIGAAVDVYNYITCKHRHLEDDVIATALSMAGEWHGTKRDLINFAVNASTLES